MKDKPDGSVLGPDSGCASDPSDSISSFTDSHSDSDSCFVRLLVFRTPHLHVGIPLSCSLQAPMEKLLNFKPNVNPPPLVDIQELAAACFVSATPVCQQNV